MCPTPDFPIMIFPAKVAWSCNVSPIVFHARFPVYALKKAHMRPSFYSAPRFARPTYSYDLPLTNAPGKTRLHDPPCMESDALVMCRPSYKVNFGIYSVHAVCMIVKCKWFGFRYPRFSWAWCSNFQVCVLVELRLWRGRLYHSCWWCVKFQLCELYMLCGIRVMLPLYPPAMKAYRGVELYLHLSSALRVDWFKWFLYPDHFVPATHWIGLFVDPRDGLGRFAEERSIISLMEIDPWILGGPASRLAGISNTLSQLPGCCIQGVSRH